MSVKRLNQLGKVSKYIMGVAIILMAITVYFSYMIVFYIALGLFLIGLLMNLILSVLKPFIMDKVLDIEALEKQGLTIVNCPECHKKNVLEDKYCIYCQSPLDE